MPQDTLIGKLVEHKFLSSELQKKVFREQGLLSDMSFWHGFIIAEIFTTISASYGWRGEFGTIHVPLLAIPAALLGGLIAAL